MKVVHRCVHQTESTSALVFCDTLERRASLSQGCKVQVLTNQPIIKQRHSPSYKYFILYTFKVPSALILSVVCTLNL